MGKNKTIKLVQKVLRDENRRKLYSPAELTYMELQLLSMKLARQKKKQARKEQKGFGTV